MKRKKAVDKCLTILNNIISPLNFNIERKWESEYWAKQQYLEKSEFKYILWLYNTYRKIGRIPGHIVELGVAYGRNAILFNHLIAMHNETDLRKYFGFDTFDGYNSKSLAQDPNLSSESWKNISVSDVERRINKSTDHNNYSLIQGDILKTVPNFLKMNPNFRCALLYVDCNAYEPALQGMEFMKDFMSPGGVICIDEKKQGGETKALIEFCKRYNFIFQKDDSPISIPAYTIIS